MQGIQPNQPNQPNQPIPGWLVTKGAKQVPNIIAINLFRHYEKQLTNKKYYQIIAIGYTNKEQTELVIYEAEEFTGTTPTNSKAEAFALSPLFRHWFIQTILYRGHLPRLLVLVKIENDVILMTLEEFLQHGKTQQEL